MKSRLRALFAVLVTVCFAPVSARAEEITFLPGAAETTGQAGGKFSSSLTVFNPGTTTATLRIGLIPYPGRTRPGEVTRTVQAGETQRIPAVLATLFGLDQDAGTLVATSTSPLVYSLSTQNVADPAGACGLALLPVPEASLLSASETGHAVWVSQSADPATGFRTNVAVTLVDPNSAVAVTVHDASGALVGQTYVSSELPSSWQGRLSDLIGGAALPVGRVEFSVVSGRATAYTVLNDNVTSDGIASQVEKVGTGSADRLLDGVAKSPGVGGSYWSSDVRLFNPGSAPIDVTIDALGFKTATAAIVQTVPPRGLLEISKVLDRFGLPDGVAGALRFRAAGPLLVGARTLNSDPTGRRPGTFSSQQFVLDLPAGLLDAGAKGFFIGIDQTFAIPGVRTNLALFGGSSGAQGRLVLRDPSGTERATATFSRGSYEWGQLNVADWFPSAAALRSSDGTALQAIAADSRIDVEVATGSLDGYISRIDNGSGDPITQSLIHDTPFCGVAPFSIEPFVLTPTPLAVGQQGTLAWEFVRDGSPIQISQQELSIDGAPPESLGLGIRSFAVQFTSAGTHTASLTGHHGCRTVGRSLDITVCGTLTITPASLPVGRVLSGYLQTLGSDGVAPLTWTRTGDLPNGIVFDAVTGTLSGRPRQSGAFTSTYTVTDAHGCTGSASLTLRVLCGSIEVSPPVLPNGVVGTPYGPITLDYSGSVSGGSWQITDGTIPPGLSLTPAGLLSGTPTAAGSFTITVRVTDPAGCSGQRTYTFTICNPMAVNPATLPGATATVSYSQALTQTGGVGATTFAITSGALPADLTLSPAGLLSGTATVTGSFSFTVTATDSLGCTGSRAYTLQVACPSITLSPASLPNATAANAYSQTLTATGGVGTKTFAVTVGALPAGLTLSGAGVLAGTPTVTGTFNFTVTATDTNGCQGTRAYTLTVVCPTVTVSPTTLPNGTAGVAYNQAFTASGGIGPYTYAVTAGALPALLSLSGAGALSGTPNVTGTFNFTVTATDANGCTGSQALSLTIVCQTITVTNPATATGTANSPFSQAFTQSGAIGTVTFSTTSTLPTGMGLSAGGTLSGTPTQTGTFPIVVKVTDGNGCTGTGSTYTLVIVCQTITVANPATTTGTANSPFSQTFTQSGAIGAVTFTTTSTLPTGMGLAANGTLSGTPTQTGTFPIVVKVTDANGCTGTGSTYNLVIACQTIAVTNPATTTGTANSPFSQTFTQSGSIGAATFSTTSTLPTGMGLSAAGVLSGTPTQTGTFPIVVKVTDANGCTGNGSTYNLVIACQTITVTNPATATGTASSPFSQTFTQSGSIGSATFTTASALPTGLTLGTNGVLSGTPTQTGTFPIVVKVTDGNGCTGNGPTYTLVISCQTISVTNPATTGGVAGTFFSQTFTQLGAIGSATFTTASTLPVGLTLGTGGVLSGTPTQTGTFPIVVTVTDSNGCTGNGATYTLVIACQTITVSNPSTATGIANSPFSQTFLELGAIGSATFTTANTLPAGLTLATNGTLSGTPTQTGTFPITVTVTDANGCTGTGGTYSLVIFCQTIAVTPEFLPAATQNAPYVGVTFAQTNGIGTIVWSQTGALPNGINFASGALSGTPTEKGTFPITVTATDSNGCQGHRDYVLVVSCAGSTVAVNPVSIPGGTVNTAYPGVTFTGSGGTGPYTFVQVGALPPGMSFAGASLTGTPTATGVFPITISVTDASSCSASRDYLLVISCTGVTIALSPASLGPALIANAYSVTFIPSGGTSPYTFTEAGVLPSGMTFSGGVLSGTPAQTGVFPITVAALDAAGCGGSLGYTLTVNQPPSITSANSKMFPPSVPTTFTVTTTGFPTGVSMVISETGTLPSGVTFVDNHDGTATISGTTSGIGSFPIVITASNGIVPDATQNFTIELCPVITVTNPSTTTGTASSPFSQTFTQSGGVGTTTFSTASTLPTGLTLHPATGVLDGTPTQTGTFPIAVTATDSNGCTGTGPTYNLVIGCQTITVTNPAVNTGTVNAPFSQTFTQSGAIASATFSTSSIPPAGLTLSAAGVLSGTPTVPGTFPVVVTVTDSNGCTGTGATYNLTINCQTITVANPAVNTGTVDAPFSQTFTQSGGFGTTTFTTASTLPAGLTLSSGGVLSGTPTVKGTFPIVVTAIDSNGCSGSSATYTLTINCQTITVGPSAVPQGTLNAAYPAFTFTQTGAHGTAAFTTLSVLPNGLTLGTDGLLSGTPTQSGSFPITVTVTDSNGCAASRQYLLVVPCSGTTITVSPGSIPTVVVGSVFPDVLFTGIGGTGPYQIAEAGTLPTGMGFAAGTLSGTPTQTGIFPITVSATDTSSGCAGSQDFLLVVTCNGTTLTVAPSSLPSVTINTLFSATTFSTSGGTGPYTYTLAGALPPGMSFSAGTLSGTPTKAGSYPIVVAATDANGCMGATSYTLVVSCQTITVTNPVNATGTAGSAFSETFTQSGGAGTTTFSTTSTLPTGLTLHSATGVLDGTPTQGGTFPITVKATDANGCTGTGATYNLVIVCPVITVTNPGVSTGTAGVAFSQTFSQSGGIGTVTWSASGTLPSGISINTSTGILSGTTHQVGSFPITVTATDQNGCQGTGATYTLVINCQTITVTNPGVNTGTAGVAFSQTFTVTGILDTVTWSETGALPSGITLNSATGVLSGTTSQTGTFPITVRATDSNGCFGTSSYTLTIVCQTVTVTNPGVTAATFNSAFSQTFTASGILGTATFTTSSTLPTGLTLSAGGVLSGTPGQTGTFPITVKATDTNTCFGTGATYTLTVAPVAQGDSYSTLVDNTQAVVTGGATTSPGTPFVGLSGTIILNDLPSGGVTASAGTFATAAGGSVTIAADGTFIYTPKANPSAAPTTSDSFTYTVVSNTGGGAAVPSAAATVTLTLANRVWYVKNNASGGGNGQSQSPFNTLVAAEVASTASDIIFVYSGNATNSGQNAGIALKDGQQLLGEIAGLTVNAHLLVAVGSRPVIGNSAGAGVTVASTTGSPRGNVVIKGLALAGSTNGIDITSLGTGTLSATVDNVVVNSAGTHGVRILGAATSSTTVAVQNSAVNAASQNGIDAQQTSSGSLVLDINNNAVVAAATGINVNGAGSTSTTITNFASNAIGSATGGSGISVASAIFDASPGGTFQTVAGGTTTIGAAGIGNGVGGSGMVLTGVSGDLSFTDLDIFADGGAGLRASGTTPYTGSAGFQMAVGTGVATVTAVGGPAVDLNNVRASSLQFLSIASTSSPTTGVALNALLGTFSAGSGSSISTVTSAAGTSFQVGTSNASITYDGTVTSTTGKGVDLTNNTGSTIAFTGALTLSSGTSNTFNASGGGTVTSTNANSTLTATTGTALTVTNTTIGASGLKFKSISANGGANGILLNNTGSSGGLTVDGDGTNAAVGGNSTGGTIQNMSGANGLTAGSGIYLNNTKDVVLRRMTITGTNQNFGIRGFLVNGFTLEYSTVNGTNGGANNAFPDDSGEGSIYFGNTATNGISTQGTFTKNSISGGAWDNMHIENTTGTTTVTVKGNTFGLNGTADGNQSLLIEARNSGTVVNAVVGGPAAGEANTFTGARADLFNATGQTGTTMDVQFKNNVLTNSHPANNIGGGSMTLASQGVMTFVVDGNSMQGADGSAVNLFKASAGTSLTGRVTNNTIGVAGIPDSASKSGNGLFLSAAGAGTIGLTITGNSIRNWHGNAGMWFDNTGGSYTANFTITGNTLAEPGPLSFATLGLTNGGNLTSDTINVCAVIGGAGGLKNTFSGAAGLGDVYLGSSGQNGGHTFNLPGYVGASDLTNVQLFVTGNNTLSGGATVIAYDDNGGAGSFTGVGSSCPTP